MLYEFLATNYDELVKRCREKVSARPAPQPTASELEYGIPLFLGQLVDTLRLEQTAPRPAVDATLPAHIGSTAGRHGNELLRKGFTVDQVVHDYGDLCQAVTELAHETQAPITVDEFRTFNRCLDNAIADAVTEFGRQRDQYIAEEGAETLNERLGALAHELRNLLNSAMLAFQALKGGSGALGGATGDVLGRSLSGLRDLIDRSLADVRLTDGMKARRERFPLHALVDEIGIVAAIEARSRGLVFTIAPVDRGLVLDADRQMLSSAIANLVQNAFKFTRPGGHVTLRASAVAERIVVEVEDECGGLAQGKAEELFHPFQQRSSDRTGLGLGLSISRRGVEANGGKLRVRNLRGTGCVFAIDLPRPAAAS
jgi:hypothetical protein